MLEIISNNIKNNLKRSDFLIKCFKDCRLTYWKIRDFIYLNYCNFQGYPIVRTHYSRIKNFGDQYNVDLLKYLGYRLIYVEDWKSSDVAITGSILQYYNSNFQGYILGAGFIKERYERKNISWKVKILRGPKSAQQCGVENNMVVYGDPGILASLIYKERGEQKYDLGIIPHYVDYEIALNLFKNHKGIKVINVRNSPKRVSSIIKECKFIASSSLHGLIFADSFRIPNVHLKFGNRLIGGLHKFDDYYLGMGVIGEYLDYNHNLTINQIIDKCKLRFSDSHLLEKQKILLNELKITLTYV